jgi:uncharacterized protein YndB with AHSA1/START domain
MESLVSHETDVPVRKSVVVNVSPARAFEAFTAEFDSWWPRSHHIGNAPMRKAIIEGFVGGRCYSEQIDDTECPWGTVLQWDPPHRFVMAWQITPEWKYEPDVSKCSEVEVQFTELAGGTTRIDLEHRYFHRHGAGGATMRTAVDSPNGWGDLLGMFAAKLEKERH